MENGPVEPSLRIDQLKWVIGAVAVGSDGRDGVAGRQDVARIETSGINSVPAANH